ncbi:hypothetical protein BLA39750_00613 [Burkholderia lata]|uniref:Uncharacterized protein n=1 Tax=Burkholderia lata (strain ATCC 17760 / DSM 23089 / LMG 22485 / NCIMB 9086 / R18194 / 383) TaxID=482957 RepID=A0A6P2UAP2_BURL3|nr:hypothetical protein BLA39750_00613 [Burkholderia lata]
MAGRVPGGIGAMPFKKSPAGVGGKISTMEPVLPEATENKQVDCGRFGV